jgi:hypothetical protein
MTETTAVTDRRYKKNFQNYFSRVNAAEKILSILLILSFPFGIDTLPA